MNEFSEKITAARKAKGLSQEAAAELLSVSRQAVAKWENGKSRPSAENLLALSKLYGIPPEELSPFCPPRAAAKHLTLRGFSAVLQRYLPPLQPQPLSLARRVSALLYAVL